LDLNSDPVVD